MVDEPKPTDSAQRFKERYARGPGAVARRVERAVLGHEVGLNGFTTIAQAEVLSEVLPLTTQGRLLDVGCGYGWPGFHVAQSHRCDLVGSDRPLDALRGARANVARRRLSGRTSFTASDGGHLPFSSASFDAIVHADVFC